MKHFVYALRVSGTKEVRYIGQTRRSTDARLLDHRRHAQLMALPTKFARWLMENDVEAIVIDECDSEFAAKCLERAKIAAALRTGAHFACETCGASFWRKRKDIKRGHNRFCSRACSNNRRRPCAKK